MVRFLFVGVAASDDDDEGSSLFEWEASVGDGGDESHPTRTRIHSK